MKLYHRQFETDQEARKAFQEKGEAIEQAGGESWPALANGAGPAFHVLVLPDSVTPESLGITDAEFKTDFEDDLDDALDYDEEDEEEDETLFDEGDFAGPTADEDLGDE